MTVYRANSIYSSCVKPIRLREATYPFQFTDTVREEVAQVTKAELVDYVAGKVGLSKTQAEDAVNAIVDGIKEGLQKDGDVRLVGFGTFNVRERKARTGRNPQTGETIMIAASKTVGFKAGKALKSAM